MDLPIITPDYHRLSTRTINGHSELVLFCISTVVELLINSSLLAIHGDSLVTSGGHDATPSPAQGVRGARMGAYLALGFAGSFVLEEESDDGSVGVTGEDAFTRHAV